VDEARPLPANRSGFLLLAIERDVLVIVVGDRGGLRTGDKGEQDVVELRPACQEDQQTGNPFYLQGCPGG
jgi:hypothetical protein